MRLDDFRKLATGSVLFNLDRIIAPRIVKVLYLLGLVALVVWAIRHFFAAFRWGFGNGLWGMVEIAVFGLLAFVALRIVCEAILVFFRAHEAEADRAVPHSSGSLLDDVRDAIEELADDEADEDTVRPSPTYSAAHRWGPAAGTAANPGTSADTATEYEVPKEAGAANARKPASEPGQNFS